MITKSTGYTSSDGNFHATLEEAQARELSLIFGAAHEREWVVDVMAAFIVGQKLKFIDILTMKPNSLPKARKINGGTKKRTPKHIADQNTLPLEAK